MWAGIALDITLTNSVSNRQYIVAVNDKLELSSRHRIAMYLGLIFLIGPAKAR